MNGIVLIALNHPYYSHMAYNLAVGIKYHGDTPITIIHAEGSLNQLQPHHRAIWNEVEIDLNLLKRNGQIDYLKAKTFLYDLSPYDKTIFLDADTILSPFKNVNELFSNKDLIFANRGEIKVGDKAQFCEVELLFEKYGINHWYDLSSEFIFFERSELNKKFFDDAKMYFDDTTIPIVTFKEKVQEKKKGIQEFNGGMPDEIPFGIAIEKNNIRFTSPYQPSYWQPQYFMTSKTSEFIKKNYYIISAGGAFVQKNIKKIYDETGKGYFSAMKIDKPFYELRPKSKFIPERRHI